MSGAVTSGGVTARSSGSKRKNVDKRREKSKYAARDRRGRESEIFHDVEEIIPLCGEQTITHIDRIAVLRLAAALCRVRHTVPDALGTTKKGEVSSKGKIQEGLDEEAVGLCLPGFLCVINKKSLIVYISQGVSKLSPTRSV